jgi:ABC-2 type transport system permease protein
MKVIEFARKEIELITSQKSSLLLVILYPMFVVLVIATAFGGPELQPQSGFERADLAYYLPQASANFDSDAFLDRLSRVERLRLHRATSPENVREAINQEIAKVGVVVHKPQTSFERVKISIYYDNTTPLVSSILMSYADFSISLFASEKSAETLTDIWDNLNSIKGELEGQRTKIDDFESGMVEGRQRISDFEERVNSIDIASIKSKLDNFDSEYYQSKSKISNAKIDVQDTQNKLIIYRQKLVNTRNELWQYSSDLKAIRADLQSAKDLSPEPIKSQLQNAENELTIVISKIDSAILEIDSAIADTDDASQKLGRVSSELDSASSQLDSAKRTVDEFKTTVNNLENTLAEMQALINESYDYHDRTKENLEQTKTLLDDLTQTLENFMRYDPQYLVRPFSVEKEKMYLAGEEFRERERTTILIPICLTIVLLLTCILFSSISTIAERKQGIDIRVHAAPISKLLWTVGKIIGQVIFALLEAGIILGLAFLLFGMPLIGSPIDLLIALFAISLAFIAIGSFLTNFTSEQSTAVLASLLIMIPFLFLSGLVFPIEFMPFYIQGLANSLPMTVGSSLLTDIIVKGIPMIDSLVKLALLLIPSIALIAFTVFRKKI